MFEHVSKALFRIRGIERQPCAAGLENAEDAHGHFHGAFDAQPDERVRADTERLEVAGKLVGARVQLGEGQLPFAADHRRLLRGARGLRLDERVDAEVGAKRGHGGG